MSSFKRFEDIQAWQKARQLVNEVYGFLNDPKFAKEFVLRDQISRAAISSMSNIAEGFSRSTSKDFAHFLDIASASASEVRSLLYIFKDRNLIAEAKFNELYNLAHEVGAMCHGLKQYLRS
jgi:four helix bundle protein